MKKTSIRMLLVCVVLLTTAFAVCTPAEANPEYLALTRKAEKERGIPFALLGGICRQESDWNPNAIGTKQEIGLCQLKQTTAGDVCPECTDKYYVLKLGAESARVTIIKRELARRKYYTGRVDTKFDARLDLAVKSFQFNNKLMVDGQVGPRTWEKLFGRKMTGNALLDMLYDPETNIELAARYLSYLMQELETRDYEWLAAAYNAGQSGASVKYIRFIRTHIRTQTDGLANAPRFD